MGDDPHKKKVYEQITKDINDNKDKVKSLSKQAREK
jgi:hypothetical protein